MENNTRTLSKTNDDPDSPTSIEIEDHDLIAELESLRQSYQILLFKSTAMEESLELLQQEREKAVTHNTELLKVIDDISSERDILKNKIRDYEESWKEKEDEFSIRIVELEVFKDRFERLELDWKESNGFLLKCLDSLNLAKNSLLSIIDQFDEVKIETCREESNGLPGLVLESNMNEELKENWEKIIGIIRLASLAEEKVREYKESKKKEKRELENSVVSLTEENRDINSLLRVALVEKEAVEKRLKGNSEQKRVALLQIAERGLQRVGFGFMVGSGNSEHSSESTSVPKFDTTGSTGTKSDSSECEEEVVSLASTVERVMKNLRFEISKLRRSLEESRSDTERLQSLTEKQGQTIAENNMYIKELEERERVLAQNVVEELLMEIKETEAEVARWREACELEVEAGKKEIGERDKLIAILKQELEKTRAALDVSNSKLKLKEELAAAAMVAQAAAEKSLQLADSRAAGLRQHIEGLSRQLEEAENRERSRRKARHICWPWRANSGNNRVQNIRRMLPEMQALLHHNV